MKTANKEKPILFSPWKVRAIYNGATQTRRPVKPQPSEEEYSSNIVCEWYHPIVLDRHGEASPGEEVFGFANEDRGWKAPYQPGDVLWVRECFYVDTIPLGRLPDIPSQDDLENIYYRADGECCDLIPECSCAEVGKPRWRPAIHMKRWAARLFLEVTDVRVQRIQDISREDCWAEGINPDETGDHEIANRSSIENFSCLWEQTYPGSWQRNDWCWCYTFKRGK